MQNTRPPNSVLATTNSIFVPVSSTNPQFLVSKMHQCAWSITSLHPSCSTTTESASNQYFKCNTTSEYPPPAYLNPHVVQPPVIPPHHLVNYQVPVIALRIAPQVPTLNKPQLNAFYSRPAHTLPCPNAPKPLLNQKPELILRHFPQNTPPPQRKRVDKQCGRFQ